MRKYAWCLVTALLLAGLSAMPAAAQSDSDIVVDDACGWEDILAARDALASQPMTLAEDETEGDAERIRTMLERVEEGVSLRSGSINIKDLELPRTTVKAMLNDLCAQTEGGEAIQKIALAYNKNDDTIATAIVPTYFEDEDEITAMTARLDEIADEINASCDTDLEKVVLLHEMLVENFAYDTENGSDKENYDAHNTRNALLEGTTVCEGYAKVYTLALHRLGISSVLVTSSSLNHAWNMVKLDGAWYQLDCTWDDKTFSTSSTGSGTSDALGYCAHTNLLVSTDSLHSSHDADDYVAFDLNEQGSTNISALASDTSYETAWWQSQTTPIYSDGTYWYFVQDDAVFFRTDLLDGEAAALTCGGESIAAGSMALDGAALVTSDKAPRSSSSTLTEYTVSDGSATLVGSRNKTNLGVAALWDGIYYAARQGSYKQTVTRYESLAEPTATPTATPTAEPTATATAEPAVTPTAAPTATATTEPTATATAAPTATATATAAPTAEPTATPGYTGWKTENGRDYWYENGVKQGTEGRGKEIYDPDSDAWYWLDAVDGGAKAVSKDVYQESSGGKWVRYDAAGRMVKGWDTNENGTYYFDLITGAMAKGDVTIDGLPCIFDEDTGIGLDCAWKRIDMKSYWYEGGRRQGYDPNDSAYRGKEIYDPASDAWYWLDNVQQGAKAVSKDVYQESDGGKWVRYDAAGRMIKGWYTNANGTYYFDLVTGAMAKGYVKIDGVWYHFDETTGISD